jgi:putative AdoMet-dependent methyltransferase
MAQPMTWDFDTYPWVDEYDDRMGGIARLHYDRTLALLPGLAEARPGQLVLDIGTGTANSALPFLHAGCHVVGVDPSHRMLRQARPKAAASGGRLLLVLAADPFLAAPFAAASFDTIVSAYVIHHLDDEAKQRAAWEVARLLRPGGRAVIADTMFRDETGKAQALAQHRDLEEEYQPLLTTFPAMFERADLSVALHQVGELVWVLVARRAGSGVSSCAL